MPDRPVRIKRQVRYVSVVALVLVAVFYAEPVWQAMQNRFEQTHIQQVLRLLSQACDGRYIEAVASGETAELLENIANNPVACLDEAGLSTWDYRGEFVEPAVIPKGSWGFDTDRSVLVYRLKYPERVVNLNPRSEELNFKLVAEVANIAQTEGNDSDDNITGLLIESVYKYRWLSTTKD